MKESTVIEGEVIPTKPLAKKSTKPTQIAAVPETPAALASPTPMTMIQTAIEKGATIEQLTQLLALQERWEANEAKKAFVKALSAFKTNPPELFKNKAVSYENKTGGRTEYKHATLDQVSNVVGEALAHHGLSHRWNIEQKDQGVITVTCVLTHEMGHSECTKLSSLPDQSGGKNAIQSVASAVTYLERYTLLAATGMATQEGDDDGRTSELKQAEPAPQEKPAPHVKPYPVDLFNANIASWKALVATGGKDPEKLIKQVETKGSLTEDQKNQIREAKTFFGDTDK